MAACLLRPVEAVKARVPRSEQLELIGGEFDDALLDAFLAGCGLKPLEAERTRTQLATRLRKDGGALIDVSMGEEGPRAEVLARKPETLEIVSRQRRRLSSVGP